MHHSIDRRAREASQQIEQLPRRFVVADRAHQQHAAALTALLEPAQVGIEAREVVVAHARARALDHRPPRSRILELEHSRLVPGKVELVAVQQLAAWHAVGVDQKQLDMPYVRVLGEEVEGFLRIGTQRMRCTARHEEVDMRMSLVRTMRLLGKAGSYIGMTFSAGSITNEYTVPSFAAQLLR